MSISADGCSVERAACTRRWNVVECAAKIQGEFCERAARRVAAELAAERTYHDPWSLTKRWYLHVNVPGNDDIAILVVIAIVCCLDVDAVTVRACASS
jgi:hypothetical protein